PPPLAPVSLPTATAPSAISPLSLHDALPISHPIEITGSGYRAPLGVDEMGIAGGIRGAPVELAPCETIDLPYIADAEIDRRAARSEEHTSELQSLTNLVCRLLLANKNTNHHH